MGRLNGAGWNCLVRRSRGETCMHAVDPQMVTTGFELPGRHIVKNLGVRARHRRSIAQHRRQHRGVVWQGSKVGCTCRGSGFRS